MSTISYQDILRKIQYHYERNVQDKRAPNGFDAALQNVCASDDTPERRLLKKSLMAWVALASSKVSIPYFNQVVGDNEEELYDQIQKFTLGDGFEAHVRSIFQGGERTNILKDAGLGSVLDEPEHRGLKRPRLNAEGYTAAPDRRVPEFLETSSAAAGEATNEVHEVPEASTGTRGEPAKFATPNFHMLDIDFLWPNNLQTHPFLRYLPRLFKQTFCDGIRKENGQACIALSYANRSADILTVEVTRQYMVHLAFKMLKITLIDKETKWRVQMSNGSELDVVGPGAAFVLGRCSEDDIQEHIGIAVLGMLKLSPLRKAEIDAGEALTRLVRLKILGEGGCGQVQIKADGETLERMKAILWDGVP